MPSALAPAYPRFGAALLSALTGRQAVCSPWSVSSALAVLAAGADAAARGEVAEALAPGSDPATVFDQLAVDAAVVAQPARGRDESVLAVANRLWVHEGSKPKAAFVDQLDQWPGAAVRFVEIVGNSEAARSTINRDVAGVTRGLIPGILPPGSLTDDDRAVMVNALYLLAGWIEPFSVARTEPEPFGAGGDRRDVPTMRGSRPAPYADDGGWQYVSLPLWLDLQAEVLLPPPGTDRLDADALAELRSRSSSHRVDLHLPRVRLSTSIDLIPLLSGLGVRRVFGSDPPALVDIIEGQPLFVSGAFHQAVLRVDERGVEGAAATAVVARAVGFVRLPEVELRFDRPFLFLVTHPATGCVLFLAHVADPGP